MIKLLIDPKTKLEILKKVKNRANRYYEQYVQKKDKSSADKLLGNNNA